jgi:hypothetical protein
LCAIGALAKAGTYSGKEVMQPAPPPCEWYRANEWDFNFWGTIAFPWNTGDRDWNHAALESFFEDFPAIGGENKHTEIDLGRTSEDRFINRDDALGGGGDIKYFFSKYWGLGGEGFVLDCNDNIGGAGLFTVTFRFPIGCSRFAPYAWAGFGGLSGGTSTHAFLFEQHHFTVGGSINEDENLVHRTVNNTHTYAIGQFGAGFEVRVTRHVGFMADFCYNAVQEDDNDFGMGRFGVTLSY